MIKSREDFERNLFLLQETKAVFSTETRCGLESVKRVRYLPNKRIDFLTVDENVRLLANTLSISDLMDVFKEEK